MKTTEELKKFKAMTAEQLVTELDAIQKKYQLTSLKVQAGKEANYSQVDKLRKDVARLQTLISEKRA